MELVSREQINVTQSTWSGKHREVTKMNTRNKKIYTKLRKSAITGKLAQVKALIAANVDIQREA